VWIPNVYQHGVYPKCLHVIVNILIHCLDDAPKLAQLEKQGCHSMQNITKMIL